MSLGGEHIYIYIHVASCQKAWSEGPFANSWNRAFAVQNSRPIQNQLTFANQVLSPFSKAVPMLFLAVFCLAVSTLTLPIYRGSTFKGGSNTAES